MPTGIYYLFLFLLVPTVLGLIAAIAIWLSKVALTSIAKDAKRKVEKHKNKINEHYALARVSVEDAYALYAGKPVIKLANMETSEIRSKLAKEWRMASGQGKPSLSLDEFKTVAETVTEELCTSHAKEADKDHAGLVKMIEHMRADASMESHREELIDAARDLRRASHYWTMAAKAASKQSDALPDVPEFITKAA